MTNPKPTYFENNLIELLESIADSLDKIGDKLERLNDRQEIAANSLLQLSDTHARHLNSWSISMKTLHSDTHDWLLGPRWTVTQWGSDWPRIQFLQHSGTRTLLNEEACWTGDGWDPDYWVPATPEVPATLLAKVERQLKGEVVTNG